MHVTSPRQRRERERKQRGPLIKTISSRCLFAGLVSAERVSRAVQERCNSFELTMYARNKTLRVVLLGENNQRQIAVMRQSFSFLNHVIFFLLKYDTFFTPAIA